MASTNDEDALSSLRLRAEEIEGPRRPTGGEDVDWKVERGGEAGRNQDLCARRRPVYGSTLPYSSSGATARAVRIQTAPQRRGFAAALVGRSPRLILALGGRFTEGRG